MRKECTLVMSVYDDKSCDLYWYFKEKSYYSKDELKEWLVNRMRDTLTAKNENQTPDLKETFRIKLARVTEVSNSNYFTNSHLSIPQDFDIEPFLSIEDNELDGVFLCDFRIDSIHKPSLYYLSDCFCDDDDQYYLSNDSFDEIISDVIRCGDDIDKFTELTYFYVKDDRGVEVCPPTLSEDEGVFRQKAREHAEQKEFIRHRTYVYKTNNGKTEITYGCCRFDESDTRAVALNLEMDKYVVNVNSGKHIEHEDYDMENKNSNIGKTETKFVVIKYYAGHNDGDDFDFDTYDEAMDFAKTSCPHGYEIRLVVSTVLSVKESTEE